VIFRIAPYLPNTPDGWRKLINSLGFLSNRYSSSSSKTNRDKVIEIENEFLKYNAIYINCGEDNFSTVEFVDEKHYTLFVLKFGVLE